MIKKLKINVGDIKIINVCGCRKMLWVGFSVGNGKSMSDITHAQRQYAINS